MIERTGALVADFARTDPRRDAHALNGKIFLWIVAGSFTLVWALMSFNGLAIEDDNGAFFTMAGAMFLLAAIRGMLRGAERHVPTAIRDFSEYCLLFMAISLLGVVSSYPIAALSSGFIDNTLARTDALLHFDWVSWYAMFVRHPALLQLGVIAYSTIYLSPAILLAYMAWRGERRAAQEFLVTFWLAAVITLTLFPFFPAKGPLAAIWSGPIPYMPTSALYQSEIIPTLRAHSFTLIDLGSLRGLVCAPSFHTVCGTLYIMTAWQFARLRWPLLALNGAMLLSTPVEGNHYLTDMFLGLAVALVASAIVQRTLRRFAPISRHPSALDFANRRFDSAIGSASAQ